MKLPRVPLTLLFAGAASACASLPKIQTAQNCDAASAATMAVRSVDRSGRSIPFAPIVVTSDNRTIRISTSTSSAGTAKFAVQPGSYAVVVGDDIGDWQSARTSIKVRPGCVVTLHAALVPHEIAPDGLGLPTRVGR